jgi:hypothetical protein
VDEYRGINNDFYLGILCIMKEEKQGKYDVFITRPVSISRCHPVISFTLMVLADNNALLHN